MSNYIRHALIATTAVAYSLGLEAAVNKSYAQTPRATVVQEGSAEPSIGLTGKIVRNSLNYLKSKDKISFEFDSKRSGSIERIYNIDLGQQTAQVILMKNSKTDWYYITIHDGNVKIEIRAEEKDGKINISQRGRREISETEFETVIRSDTSYSRSVNDTLGIVETDTLVNNSPYTKSVNRTKAEVNGGLLEVVSINFLDSKGRKNPHYSSSWSVFDPNQKLESDFDEIAEILIRNLNTQIKGQQGRP